VFSAWHPLWVGGPAHAELADELAARGLEYLNTEHPTATLFPDGESAFLSTDAAANDAEHGDAWRESMAAVGAQAELVFGVLDSTPEAKEAGKVVAPLLLDAAAVFDPDLTGGAVLLGVDGVCVISHGSSSARAIVNAVRVAQECVEAGVVGRLKESVDAG